MSMWGPCAQEVKPTEDFILVIDADMIMRQPFDPIGMGAGPGWAISAFFGYMKGVSNELAMRHVPYVFAHISNVIYRIAASLDERFTSVVSMTWSRLYLQPSHARIT